VRFDVGLVRCGVARCGPVQLIVTSLWSSSDYMCAVPRTHNSFGGRSFGAVGPRSWNSLLRLRNILTYLLTYLHRLSDADGARSQVRETGLTGHGLSSGPSGHTDDGTFPSRFRRTWNMCFFCIEAYADYCHSQTKTPMSLKHDGTDGTPQSPLCKQQRVF